MTLVTAWGIIGGQPAESYPFYALVMMGDQKCGGTLITEDVVLTAAHCLYHHSKRRWPSPIDIYVLYGDFFPPNGWILKYHSCENYHVPQNYDPNQFAGTGPYDVALVKLEQKIAPRDKLSKPYLRGCIFCLEKRYTPGTVIGLGLTNQNPNRHAIQLMEAEMHVNTSCGKHNSYTGFVNRRSQVCYSAPNGESKLCKGDSGGPIVYKQDGKALCIIGLATYVSRQCDSTDYPTIFADAGAFHHWIKRRLVNLQA